LEIPVFSIVTPYMTLVLAMVAQNAAEVQKRFAISPLFCLFLLMVNDHEVELLKKSILRSLAETSNVELLNRVNSILNETKMAVTQETQVGFHADGRPYSLAELRTEVEASQAEFEAGEYLTIQALQEASKLWK
jgi:hypothetical protein